MKRQLNHRAMAKALLAIKDSSLLDEFDSDLDPEQGSHALRWAQWCRKLAHAALDDGDIGEILTERKIWHHRSESSPKPA